MILGIGIGIWAFIIYIAAIIIWMLVLKRNIAECMGIGFLIVALFNGFSAFPGTLGTALLSASKESSFLATMLFLLMSVIMTKTGMIARLVELLNSIIGRIKGGAAYVSVCASFLFGLVSGNAIANCATVGAITVPWMKESGWPKEVSATMNAGNAGVGQSMPSCTAMFLLLGLAPVAAAMTVGQAYIAVLCGGAWTFVYRLIRVWLYAKKYNVQAVPEDQIKPFGQSFHDNWTSLLMLAGIAIPLLLTMGPVAKFLPAAESFAKAGVSSINIVLWVPVVVSVICLIVGRKSLPQTGSEWIGLLKGCQPTFATVGGVLLFALAASNVLTMVGFDQDLKVLLEALTLPNLVMIILTCIMIVLVAGPLSAVATTAAVGSVAFSVFVGAGVNPIAAVVAFMICISTEGASPPSSSPIFISCGLAEVEDPKVIFVPLITDYVLPLIGVATLVAVGVLPIIR
ncbi:TRAP transporter large permease subunit [Faecalispora jeddahensis]|uniref:TRAP transporter large permease subunit n=1 Tax=Faecalispora jeddahensis TaxID=1414721 RepID=UPI00189920B8|nr:TRAP transporter large permease subunit [Faecalispora jeddahensis]